MAKYWVANNPNAEITDTQARGLASGSVRVANFGYSLAGTNAADVTYTTNDSLLELGSFDTSAVVSGMETASLILIKNVWIHKTVVADNALSANIFVSATSGTLTNVAPSTPTEVAGAGATYLDLAIGTDASVTEVDFTLSATGLQLAKPHISVASTLKYVYLCSHTGISSTVQAGRGNIVIEYVVI